MCITFSAHSNNYLQLTLIEWPEVNAWTAVTWRILYLSLIQPHQCRLQRNCEARVCMPCTDFIWCLIWRSSTHPNWHCHYPTRHLYSSYHQTIRQLVLVRDRFGLCRLVLIRNCIFVFFSGCLFVNIMKQLNEVECLIFSIQIEWNGMKWETDRVLMNIKCVDMIFWFDFGFLFWFVFFSDFTQFQN